MAPAKQKPTHFRIKLNAVSLPGGLHDEGQVVAIDTIPFSSEDTLEAILAKVEETGNTYGPLEAGVLDEGGAFVPVPEPERVGEDGADESTES